ncbi:MAG: hypothetical protein MUP55_00700 [Candidatus Aenigmarchaeota archaeon]|nr:hypothetical protein [Candidatus Aenigmarchaeota archaeon]
MNGLWHLIVALCGLAGLFIGSVVLDLDHHGLNLKNARDCFLSLKSCKTTKGIFHNLFVASCIIIFLITLAMGYSAHLILDAPIK